MGTSISRPFRLGQGQHSGQRDCPGSGKAGPLLRAVVVGEDRYLVVGRQRALDGAERIIDLGHHVGGQALVDDESDRERRRIDGEDLEIGSRVSFS